MVIIKLSNDRNLGNMQYSLSNLDSSVQAYSPCLEENFQKRKSLVSSSCRMDKTYIKIHIPVR